MELTAGKDIYTVRRHFNVLHVACIEDAHKVRTTLQQVRVDELIEMRAKTPSGKSLGRPTHVAVNFNKPNPEIWLFPCPQLGHKLSAEVSRVFRL